MNQQNGSQIGTIRLKTGLAEMLNLNCGITTSIPMVFIRAPRIRKVGKKVHVLSTWQNTCVMACQENILVSTFHPELTNDLTIDKFFVSMLN